jgi:SAM-dependent methyltransferase
MAEVATALHGDTKELGGAEKDRSRFRQVLQNCVSAEKIDLQGSVLIVGAGCEDVEILHHVGFRRMTLTNLQDSDSFQLPQLNGADLDAFNADVEDMQIADGSYDLVLAHEVLHHCRSPHKALLEMLRVSRKHVIIMEPNDSLLMRAFVKLRFSFPYELPVVIDHNFQEGGVRNSCVPNYIYRWNARDMYQTTASFIPEKEFSLHVRRYWDFNVSKDELALRSQTRIGSFTKILGPDLFLACLHGFQTVVNRLPWLGEQGNKFFGCITVHDNLKPWLVRENGGVAFNRLYGTKG